MTLGDLNGHTSFLKNVRLYIVSIHINLISKSVHNEYARKKISSILVMTERLSFL